MLSPLDLFDLAFWLWVLLLMIEGEMLGNSIINGRDLLWPSRQVFWVLMLFFLHSRRKGDDASKYVASSLFKCNNEREVGLFGVAALKSAF